MFQLKASIEASSTQNKDKDMAILQEHMEWLNTHTEENASVYTERQTQLQSLIQSYTNNTTPSVVPEETEDISIADID